MVYASHVLNVSSDRAFLRVYYNYKCTLLLLHVMNG